MQKIENDNQFHDDIIANFIIITDCKDDEKAIQYLQMSNFQLENAIQLYLECENHQPHQEQQAPTNKPIQQISKQQKEQIKKEPEINENEQRLIEKYIKYKENQNEQGKIKQIWNQTVNSVTQIFKKPPNYGEEFQKYLQAKSIKIRIQFQMEDFYTNLKQSNKDFLPLFVYVQEMDMNSINILKKIFACKEFNAIVNNYFRCFGFIANAQSLQQLPEQVTRTPVIQIYRVNFVEEYQLMETIYPSQDTDFQQIAEKLKQIRGQFNQIHMIEQKVKKNVDQPKQINQLIVHELYNEQQKIEEQKRQKLIQQERDLLRQQQEEAYFLAELQAKEKQTKIEQEKLQQQQQIQMEKDKEEDRQFQKAQLLSQLPIEPLDDCVCFKFQFFDKFLTRNFAKSDKIQILFDYVKCQDDQYFQNYEADIDLIQNFPKLSLKDKKEKTIAEIFEDSTGEQLIIEEID